jgi:hypothetical protein
MFVPAVGYGLVVDARQVFVAHFLQRPPVPGVRVRPMKFRKTDSDQAAFAPFLGVPGPTQPGPNANARESS